MEDFAASVVPGSLDSLSLPSEPPDIRNWFSSYVYESLPFSAIGFSGNSLVKESENEVERFSTGETDEENVGVAARESKRMRKNGSYEDHKPQNRRLSEVPDGELSESLPSEPPHISNYFSSYVYESPLLDTSDCLSSPLPGEGERIREEVVKRESKKETKKMTKLDKCHASTWEFELEPVSFAKVTDFSHSPSLLSEPPDVRNWFSSYKYESPELSELDELGYVSPEKDGLAIEESDIEEETNFGMIRKTKNKQEIVSPDRLKSSVYKEKITAKKSFAEKEFRGSSDTTQLHQHLEKKTSTGLLNGSTKELKQEIQSGLKQESSVNHEPFLYEPKPESSHNHGISPCNLKPPSNWKQKASLCEPKLEYLQETTTMNTRLGSPRRATQKVTLDESLGATTLEANDKENLDGESTEIGFVTMKKDRFRGATERNSKLRLDRGNLTEWSRRKESAGMACEEDGENMKRKVLGETTNLICPVTMEISGKWRCPQKNKVNVEPPLKQLRLEKWVQRL